MVQEIAVNIVNLRVVFRLSSVEVCCLFSVVFKYEDGDPFLTSEKSDRPPAPPHINNSTFQPHYLKNYLKVMKYKLRTAVTEFTVCLSKSNNRGYQALCGKRRLPVKLHEFLGSLECFAAT